MPNKADRFQIAREPEADKAPEVTWNDVRAALGPVEVRDEDYCYRYVWDEDAPESVLEDPSLLRAWIAHHHPESIFSDEAATATAENRRHMEIVHRFRAADTPRSSDSRSALGVPTEREGMTPRDQRGRFRPANKGDRLGPEHGPSCKAS